MVAYQSKANGSAEDRSSDEASMIVDESMIKEEIRIVQTVQTQENTPALMIGLAASVVVVCYLDWSATLSGHAIYPLASIILMLIPSLRSYLKLRGRKRPSHVSKRRIRALELYTGLFGLAWAVVAFLILGKLGPTNGAFIIALMSCLCFGAVALNPGLPRASTLFCGIVLIALSIGVLTNEITRPDLMAIMIASVSLPIARTIWQNWHQLVSNVTLGLEKLQAEAEARVRETRAMRTMIEAIPFPLVLTRESGALEMSKTAAHQFGIPEEDAKGHMIRDFFVNSDDQIAMARLQAEKGQLDAYEVQLQNKQGEVFWVLLSSLPLKYEGEDCWLNAIYVIDDRKRAEADLIEAHATLARVSDQLAKYISPQLYQAIFSGKQRVTIESKRKKLSIFFSDIVNFSEITDELEPEELTTLLNQYLTEMSIIALENGAYFDKFVGDAMMFYFGDPETRGVKEDASACVHMAVNMQRRLSQLQDEWRERGLIDRPFEARMGVNTGYCTVGNFGSEDRMDYTIIGREVNLASRLESHAEAGNILISAETYAQVKQELIADEREAITVKGFPKPIRTFAVQGIQEELTIERCTSENQ